MKKVYIMLFALVLFAGVLQAAGFSPELQAILERASPTEKIRVTVYMAGEADLSTFNLEAKAEMVQYLKDFASSRQRDLLSTLPRYGDRVSDIQPFWIANLITMAATKDVILEIAKRHDVSYIEHEVIIQLDDLKVAPEPDAYTVEWGIRRVRADSVWRMLSITGQGVTVGNIDTGVRTTHVTFGGRWRGGTDSWIDCVNNQTTPYDDHNHGTHTMGTICGGSTVDTIGVARGAIFVAAKAFNSSGSGSTADILEAFQWLATLAGNNRAPKVVGNSWGSSRTSTSFWQAIRNNQALGIIHVFSIGNSGSGGSTANAPGNYPNLLGVGATDNSAIDSLASFSSRGPAPTGMPWDSAAVWLDTLWGIRTPTNHVKPDLSAPGVNVRSSLGNGNTNYGNMSGTSMASPHVTGCLALMLQKNRYLTYRQIWYIITANCDRRSGVTYPNQLYGWGRLNCYKAVQATPAVGMEEEINAKIESPVTKMVVTPNPVSHSARIQFSLVRKSRVSLKVYNYAGQHLATLVDARLSAGTHNTCWDTKSLPSGVYFYRMDANAFMTTQKIVIVR